MHCGLSVSFPHFCRFVALFFRRSYGVLTFIKKKKPDNEGGEGRGRGGEGRGGGGVKLSGTEKSFGPY